jgi:hypothetical protein
MVAGDDDPVWEAFVSLVLPLAAVQERRSRYADKPALWFDGREIAHREAPGVIDLRITRSGWSEVGGSFRDDPGVSRDPRRRDWLELHLESAAQVAGLAPLITAAVASNHRTHQAGVCRRRESDGR